MMKELVVSMISCVSMILCGIVSAQDQPPREGSEVVFFGTTPTAVVARLDPPLAEVLSESEFAAVSHFDDALQELVQRHSTGGIDRYSDLPGLFLSTAVRYGDLYQMYHGKAVVEITVVGDIDRFKDQLLQLGDIEVLAIADGGYYYLLGAAVGVDQLLAVAQVPGLRMAVASGSMGGVATREVIVPYAPKSQGTADNQAETALEVDAIRRVFPGADGGGIAVGTLGIMPISA